MAAATLLDGPASKGFLGRIDAGGFSYYVQHGRAKFPTTDLTCTIKLNSGGMMGKPAWYIQYSVVDKTAVATFNADYTIATITRTDATSEAEFCYEFRFAS
jgi:hypothetical protein